MISPKFRSMLKGESVIRKMNSQGNAIAEKIGAENVFDFSIGNPSVPAPENLNAVFEELLTGMDSVLLHATAKVMVSWRSESRSLRHCRKDLGYPSATEISS